ncbi:MAG: hypothetical protein KIT09_15140 [Bryobacteraceae bacterium]|nr:hypothetical protein [Bryobacteraceae bacterium]
MRQAGRAARTVLICGLLALAAPGTSAPDKVVPAINEIDPWQPVGLFPYEMTWVERQEPEGVLVDFEDLNGWTLELHGGTAGEFRRTREQQIWGQHVGKFAFGGSGRVVARPPAPIAIPRTFDSIEMWGYGNRWGRRRDDPAPPVNVSVLLVDARGKETAIQITDIKWRGWWLIHRRPAKEELARLAAPLRFSGIEIAMPPNTERRYFFCDALAFNAEKLPPLNLKPQPKRNLKPFRGQIVGLNTGEGTLEFPTREETILPSNVETGFRVTAAQPEPGRFEFRYEGRDAKVTYEYRPRAGNLGELTASVNGGRPFRPLNNGGVLFADTPEGRTAEGELIAAALKEGVVEAKFRVGSRIVEYNLRLWQKSLVLDVWCDGGEATELSFGQVAGVDDPKLIVVPYITYRYNWNPRVLLSKGPVFTSVWWDWYRTNASEPYVSETPKAAASGAEVNGGMRYIPKTDGTRNNLYERIFVTNSPVYEETLPTIPNPPSLSRNTAKEVVWTVTAPPTFEADHRNSRLIRSYGIDKIMQHSHEVTWRDDGDSFTMKLHAAPQKGGDARLRWYVAEQEKLGWLQGVYTNYTDFATVNSNWSPDHVQRLPDGEWRRAWPRCYALKPAKAVEFDEYYAKRIHERFGVKMSYTDVHTAVPPWEYCDFDARVPGAGTLAATFYAYGQLLRNDQRVYGVSQTEATMQWLYAGLDTGAYGWVYTNVNLLTHPVDVAFRLHKIHPLHAEYGMGAPSRYMADLDPNWTASEKRREYLDLFLATTIAYGNFGWLVKDFGTAKPFGVEALARSYYMMQQLQQQYAFQPVKRIEYADAAGKFLTPSQAHVTGALAESRLHVVYERGAEVFVNRGGRPWTVKDGQGQAVELPPSGWLAFHAANRFRELSANAGGRRIDHVQAPAYEFLDGRGQWTEYGNLGATGSVAMRRKGEGGAELIDIYGNEKIAFRAEGEGTLMAYDPEDRPLGTVEVASRSGGWKEFRTMPQGRRYAYARAVPQSGSGR